MKVSSLESDWTGADVAERFPSSDVRSLLLDREHFLHDKYGD